MITTFATGASAFQEVSSSFFVEVNPALDLVDVVLFYTIDGSSAQFVELPNVTAGSSVSFPVTIEGGEPLEVSLMAKYLNPALDQSGLSLGVNPGFASASLGSSFESLFPGHDEQGVIDSLGDPGNDFDAHDLFQFNLWSDIWVAFDMDNFPNEGALLNFSDATQGGSWAINPVPEPFTMGLLGLGLAAAAGRRRRNKR